MTRVLLEKDIQEGIIQYLRLMKYVVFKHHSTGFTVRNGKTAPFRYGDKGVADIIGCAPNGRFIAVEVKRPGGVISDDQQVFLDGISKNGGVALVAFSLDDVVQALRPGN